MKSVLLLVHTQKLNLAPLKPWVLCEKNGKIIVAHCTCIAGLGEACTHAAALLFAVESLVRTHANQSKTDVLCTWNGPSNSIGIVRVKKLEDMLFSAKKSNQCITSPKIPTASPEEISAFLSKVKTNSFKAPVACYISENLNAEFSTRISNIDELVGQNEARVTFNNKLNDSRPKVFVKGSWRCIDQKATKEQFERAIRMITLNTYYKLEYKHYDLQMLLHASSCIAMSITEDDAKFVESITRDQYKNWIWQKLRVGRVTGSTFKNVCRARSLKKPSITLLMKICYSEKSTFFSKATEYGKQNEDEAKKSFIDAMQSTHKNFSCNTTGLVIDHTNHFLAASPDGSCLCECCGEYLLELKCPYSLSDRNSTYDNLLNITDPYIVRYNDTFILNKNHSYYYQMQLQMAVCRKRLCYFHVSSKHLEPISLAVNFDQKFMEDNLPKTNAFIHQVLVPEIMSSFYTNTY